MARELTGEKYGPPAYYTDTSSFWKFKALEAFIQLRIIKYRSNFTLPVRDPPYWIITRNFQGNLKLN